jgi:hypothetical protein
LLATSPCRFVSCDVSRVISFRLRYICACTINLLLPPHTPSRHPLHPPTPSTQQTIFTSPPSTNHSLALRRTLQRQQRKQSSHNRPILECNARVTAPFESACSTTLQAQSLAETGQDKYSLPRTRIIQIRKSAIRARRPQPSRDRRDEPLLQVGRGDGGDEEFPVI